MKRLIDKDKRIIQIAQYRLLCYHRFSLTNILSRNKTLLFLINYLNCTLNSMNVIKHDIFN